MRIFVLFIHTPFGEMTLVEAGGALKELRFTALAKPGEQLSDTPLLLEAQRQLAEYFEGKRKTFTVPLAPEGTAFQQAVWQAILTIPYGQTATYGDIANQVGNPRAARAVGMANHYNPLAIFYPCHRVVAAGGKLGGYGYGRPTKEYLLALEANHARPK